MKENLHAIRTALAVSLNEPLLSGVHPLSVPLPPDQQNGWKPYPVFQGETGQLTSLSCHASVLSPGCSPHPPHTHKEEEILILLSGEVELILPHEAAAGYFQRIRLGPGQLVYYPAFYTHTLQATGESPANYLMWKWYNDQANSGIPLGFGCFESLPKQVSQHGKDLDISPVFEGPTDYLRRLHCHSSVLASGCGYDPHRDDYDVTIVVLEGEIETLGERAGPWGVVFYRAGELHGMRNHDSTAAKYLVFEFHGRGSVPGGGWPFRYMKRLIRLAVPSHWRVRLRRMLSRILRAV